MRNLTEKQQAACNRFNLDSAAVTFMHPFVVQDGTGVYYVGRDGTVRPAGLEPVEAVRSKRVGKGREG